MKKVINILVSIIFLTSFVGVQIHKHYSQGKLYSVAIFTEAESCCADMEHCEMTNMQSCSHQSQHDCSCKDETEIAQLHEKFVVSKKLQVDKQPVFDIVTACCLINNIVTEINLKQTFISSSPPDKSLDTQSEFGVFLC